jgi:hypothetical protein
MRLARARRYAVAVAALTAAALPLTSLEASASASTAISARAFGMHYTNTSSPYLVQFGASRVWDMRVTWRDLQPRKGVTSAAAIGRLDKIVATMRAHGAQPMITLGMTPAWAAHKCNHYFGGVNWGLKTCAPVSTSTTGAWGSYVRMLAKRYQGKVTAFELWNEPTLHNGYNDSVRTLAKMQTSAQQILHRYGAKLISPGIAFTDGSPKHGLRWLDNFLSLPGGRSFDIVGLHLYPADAAARAGNGPEWAMTALASARSVLRSRGVSGRPVWNTETNVGRAPAHTTQGGGTRGAAMVARTYLLATEHNVARTFWYAADDRTWGGTWLENSHYKGLTPAGHAYAVLQKLIVGAHPRGCSVSGTHYTCRYRLASGKSMLAVWSTRGTFAFHGPAGTKQLAWVSGGGRSANRTTKVTVGAAPVYVIGTFKV